MQVVHYDIHNPMKRRRMLYDGLGPTRDDIKGPPTGGVMMPTPITIEAGETKKGVPLSEAVAARIIATAAKHPDDEVVLLKSAAQPVEKARAPNKAA